MKYRKYDLFSLIFTSNTSEYRLSELIAPNSDLRPSVSGRSSKNALHTPGYPDLGIIRLLRTEIKVLRVSSLKVVEVLQDHPPAHPPVSPSTLV